jgi:GrpB-like predicted nucleotidyltransferase (UPF0157 family)
MFPVNIHIFPNPCAEAERHRIFRDWIRSHPEDLQQYAEIKRESARIAVEGGEDLAQYTARKADIIRSILHKAYKELQYI